MPSPGTVQLWLLSTAQVGEEDLDTSVLDLVSVAVRVPLCGRGIASATSWRTPPFAGYSVTASGCPRRIRPSPGALPLLWWSARKARARHCLEPAGFLPLPRRRSHPDRRGCGAHRRGRRVGAGEGAELTTTLQPAEQAELAAVPYRVRAAAFTQLWTRKEAYLQALGTGRGRDLAAGYLGTGGRAAGPPGQSPTCPYLPDTQPRMPCPAPCTPSVRATWRRCSSVMRRVRPLPPR
ncbi:4'-phosphopantetheinyl transferase superfamily protein [Streptomyces sp. NPDC005283]|uniref:4'-phosphopantetheinyl transferase superfamily protein n=1 Tax=Streptomyces sp. NPDC005283 TaxID=3156871 RepID=UPI0034552C6D